MEETLSQQTYEAIRDLVYRKAGINLGSSKQALVNARIGKRLRFLGIQSAEEYVRYLRQDRKEEELVHLLDVISTNHTYFFREPEHFVLLKEWLQKQVQSQSRLRIWCAAASTGEEPYTLSMVIQEALKEKSIDLKILATDISTQVLQKCRLGLYPETRMDSVSKAQKSNWWTWDAVHSCWSAKDKLKKPLTFARLNLMETPYPMKGPFDAVFCRNVMIYFDTDGRKKIVNEVRRLLKPGGLFVVGHSESLTGIHQGFQPVQPSVYVRETLG